MEWLKKVIYENIPVIHLGFLLALELAIVIGMTLSSKTREFLCDDGRLSMGRLLCFVLVISYVFYAGYVTIAKGILPDFPSTVAMLVGALYGINKASGMGILNPPGSAAPPNRG